MLVTTALLGLLLLVATPTSVLACQSDQPSFRHAVNGAEAIATVTLVDAFDHSSKEGERYRVVRVLKGTLPDRFKLASPYTTLCHDTVGGIAGREGSTVVVAFDVPYYGQTIHPAWSFDANAGLRGSAGVPARVDSLRTLEAAILAELGTRRRRPSGRRPPSPR